MFPPADRTALDLLEAHLEALWGAADAALPPEPHGLAAEGGGELVRWTLDRLRSIPPEPRFAFTREVGDLLAELRSRRSPWNAAALRLLNDTYTFVTTGPLQHQDWTQRRPRRAAPDGHRSPRLAPAGPGPRQPARRTVPAYRFDPPAPEDWPAHR